uniref:Uncharacterized protein n=1 Tax=Anguilla anguilla TaxID=7936 RepID=A0A0E9VSR2_ANGAN
MARDDEDIQALEDSLQVYKRATLAWINWGKCEALMCGDWSIRPLL